ncbi:MAG TPA: xanthine dehydrogenase family protein subunit M [Burkholderiales bacterium]|jgi:carbon-monoxide dehydrogenase medium subunit|nr:xanthine dehydrogenase family protein subunit M [Burkholderiales bacterium]
MSQFNFSSPASTSDALKAFKAAADPKFVAGGQSLLPTIRLGLADPSDLIDLHSIAELSAIKTSATQVSIGAMATHASVAESAEVARLIPALAYLAGHIGDRQVRNRGTIGGALANSDPAACYPAGVLGLGATINTDRRKIAADDYFQGLFTTALEPGEIITSVDFPVPEKAAYVKLRNPASHFPLVGVFVARTAGGVRVAVTGAGACAFRVKAMEDALKSSFSADAIKGVKVDAKDLNRDLHATPAYRAQLINVLARRAVAAA